MTIENNMTPVQSAAFRLLTGKDEVQGGKVDLTVALVPVLGDVLSYTFENANLTFTVLDYLPEFAPRKRATSGDRKGELVKDNAHQRARAVALNLYLGMDDEQSGKIGSEVLSCIRAAAGITALDAARGDDVVASVSISDAGNLIVPVSVAYRLFDDKGEATPVGKAAYQEAYRDEMAIAKAVAKVTGSAVVVPDEDAVWDTAANLPVECSGAKQKQGGQPVSPYGDLPTNTAVLAELVKLAVVEGVIPAPATRQGQTPDGDTSATGKALAHLCAVLKVNEAGAYPEAFTSAQLSSIRRVGKLVVAFEKAEANAEKAAAAALLEAAKEA